MANLYIYPKSGEPSTFPLAGRRVTVGRSSANDIVLSDQFSSGVHAVIAPTEHGYALIDQGSKNGTFVNGRRVNGEIDLARGDEILIGSTRFFFDKDFQPPVETVEGTTFTHSSNTIIQVKDILRKTPGTGVIMKTPGGGLDLERLQKDQKTSSVLTAVSQALIYHMPLEKLLGHIMDVLIQHLPMDRGVLMIKNEATEALEPKVVRIQNGALRNQSIFVSQTIVRTALERNSAILISDIQADEDLREQFSVIQARIHSAMCVPLWNNQDIIGLIYCDRASLLEQFSEDDLRLLTLLGNLAAVKIENARLYEQALEKARQDRELALATQIQMNFLPRTDPDFAPYEVSGSARACRHVGGDYFDYIAVDKDRLALVIADVSGVGVSASLLMASLRGGLHERFPGVIDLAQVASHLNDFVYASSDSHLFISFFLAILDRTRDELSYVNAGHNPPLVVGRKGPAKSLETTGLCLGMFPGQAYREEKAGLAPGDILCLYTDGIVESRAGGGEEYGEKRLADKVRELRGRPAREIRDRLFEDVFAFSACDEAGDDMTLVVVKRNP
ncbi:MAG TPA: SpoIIE family protein phosphatase [Candidatus Aminicenantes bacterium]|nr:SpoIIE family protein phosphatase [Candidatus Aminicenantes bacterium]HRY65649.1 SpoIIE family protein phosphatase [Candidatus Aminicenantes bacterium]HRZ72463.1 SpoIIE family protein phosphatase [Candidatus Aminicenantes bacterium]